MSNPTYRLVEIAGTSPLGITEAIQNGVVRAASTLRGLDWFEVTSIRGSIADDAVQDFQVQMKVGFRLEDTD